MRFQACLILLAAALGAHAQSLVIERSHTTTEVSFTAGCDLDAYRQLCRDFADYYVSRFENARLQSFTASVDYSSPDLIIEIPHARQQLFIDLRPLTGINLISVLTRVTTETDGRRESYVETANLDARTLRHIGFRELFEKPETAAMICSRLVERHFREHGSELLPLAVAAVEVNPTHFIILPDGLRLVFPPRLVAADGAESALTIKISELMEAGPDLSFFPAAAKP